MTGAGELIWRVRIERPDSGDHEEAAGAVRWIEIGRAFVRRVDARVDAQQSGAGARVVWTFLMRTAPLQVGARLRRGSRAFLVIAVTPDADGGLLRLTCEEHVATEL